VRRTYLFWFFTFLFWLLELDTISFGRYGSDRLQVNARRLGALFPFGPDLVGRHRLCDIRRRTNGRP
jgi:hypothetical protein